MRAAACFVLLLLWALSSGQDPQPDRATPEAAVRAFVNAWNRKDMQSLSRLIDGSPPPERLRELFHPRYDPWPTFVVNALEIVRSGSDAVAIYDFNLRQPGEPEEVREDMVRLRLTEDGWRLRPPRGNGNTSRVGLSMVVGLLLDPDRVRQARVKAVEEACTEFIRQLAFAFLMLSFEHDDVLKFGPAQSLAREAVAAHIPTPDLWRCPSEKGSIAYSFNVRLAGKSLARIADPSKVVMLYEGAQGKLNFRHDGRAAVAFADGRTRLVTEAEAQSLLWTVDGR